MKKFSPNQMRRDQTTNHLRPRLLALRPVTIEADCRLQEQVEAFYRDVLGFGKPAGVVESTGTIALIYRNDGPDLIVRLTPSPDVWENRPRAIIEFHDIFALCERLRQVGAEYQFMRGWCWTDQRVGFWDPSGNRLEAKRLWRLF